MIVVDARGFAYTHTQLDSFLVGALEHTLTHTNASHSSVEINVNISHGR